MWVGEISASRILVGKSGANRTLGRPRRRWQTVVKATMTVRNTIGNFGAR